MEENYTENVLIRYIYKEADLFEKLEVENALENDRNIKNLFENLMKGFHLLPKAKFVPSSDTIDRILFASREAAWQA